MDLLLYFFFTSPLVLLLPPCSLDPPSHHSHFIHNDVCKRQYNYGYCPSNLTHRHDQIHQSLNQPNQPVFSPDCSTLEHRRGVEDPSGGDLPRSPILPSSSAVLRGKTHPRQFHDFRRPWCHAGENLRRGNIPLDSWIAADQHRLRRMNQDNSPFILSCHLLTTCQLNLHQCQLY